MGDRPGRWGPGENVRLEGCRPPRPVSQSPASLSPGRSSWQTGYQLPGMCPRMCSHSVMHDLREVKKPGWCTMPSDPYI